MDPTGKEDHRLVITKEAKMLQRVHRANIVLEPYHPLHP